MNSVLFVAFPEVDNRISNTNTLRGQARSGEKPVASNARAWLRPPLDKPSDVYRATRTQTHPEELTLREPPEHRHTQRELTLREPPEHRHTQRELTLREFEAP